jgi:peptide/nickel transport system permease protein
MNTFVFCIKNIARMLLLLFAVSVAAFALVSLSPVDPLAANVGQTALGSMSGEQLEKLELYWGVDEPPVSRYLAWAGDFVRGDMGVSLEYRRGVASVIGEKLSNSLWLMAAAWAVSGVVGFALGAVAGVNQGRLPDRLIKGFALVTASTPAFWLALLALLIFSVWLGWFPIGLAVPIGIESASLSLADRLRHAVLPATVLSLVSMSGVILHTRAKMIDSMASDYALFALARGESRRQVAVRHGLRNVLLPAITLQFASISEIFGGSVLVEQVFSYPGLGKAAVAAGIGGDIPLLMGITVISAAIVFAGNLTANLLYGVIDPRMRRGRRA